MSILECTALSKNYGRIQALQNIDLSLDSGRIVGLVGPNGSGKTTLIKLAQRLLTPTSGIITVDGMLPGPQTHAHYVTVTGADSDWLQISSWGKRYYIRKDDYLSYVKRHSARLFSNILYIREKKHGED